MKTLTITSMNLFKPKSLKHFIRRNVILVLLLSLICNTSFYAQTPVAENGKLKVVGTNLTNEAGTPVQLRGMSSHGVNWFTHEYNFNSLDVLVNEWGIDVFRIAMYATEQPDQTMGGYEGNPEFWRQYIDDLVDLCGQFGIYAIIDWHILTPGDPTDPAYYQMAKDFWDYMSETHAGKDHVLYEIANEPNGVNWATCKSYAETIIPIIRANDPNTIILIGNPTWSSDVHIASADPVTGYDNLMYSFHFYAGSHGQTYRDNITTALNNGIAIFATEWGTTLASGDGDPIIDATNTWIQFFQDNNISWCNWSYSDKPEGSAALLDYSAADELWDNTSLSGTHVKSLLQTPADSWTTTGNKPPVVSINRELYGAYYELGETITLSSEAIDADGSVSSVSYYANGTLIGSSTSAPYTVTWSPSSTDIYGLSAQATDNNGATNTSVVYTVNVVNEIVQTAYPSGTPHAIPGTIKTWQFDNGGEMISYHDIDGVHKGPSGSERAEEGVDVEGSSNIGYVLSDEWLEYTVDIANSGNYDFTLKATSGYAVTGQVHLELDGQTITDVKDIPSSGNWWTYQDNVITDVPLSEGIHVLRLVFDKGFFNVSDISFEYVGGNIPVSGVSATPSELTINKGETSTITANVTPSNATNKTISWSSNNTSVATVNSSGEITALNEGQATITVTTTDGNFTADCDLTVTDINIPVTGIELLPVTISVEEGRTTSLTANVVPSNATNKAVSFESNNTGVATVNSSGIVSGVSVGTATITATTVDGSFSDQTTVTVTEQTQGGSYPFGLLPTNASAQDAQDAYTTFINLFFEDCNDGKGRIKWGLETNGWEQPGQSVSEGIAYGMLLAAYFNDQVNFDKLWNYYKAFPDANGLMNWKTSGCSSVLETNAATDAEVDAAMALIVADKTWGNSGAINYKSDAEWIIGQIKQYEVESGSYVLKPGDVFGGSDLTNISYFAPGYFKAFGEYTNDETFWSNVVDKCYQIIDANLTANNAVGGIVSDWCNASGTQAQGKSLNYSYDACRTNWRIATDYIWYGDSRAKTYLDKSNDFVQNFIGGIENVVDGYMQDGSEIAGDRYHNSTFVATFACAGVSLSNQTEIDTYYSEIEATAPVGYFDFSFDLFSRTLLSGLFTNPVGNVVNIPVTEVNISPSTIGINIGESASLAAEITPSNATNKSVVWSSSNTNIATVNQSGLVSGVAEGNATITATTVDGSFTSTCAVTVSNIVVPTYTLTASTTGNGSVVFTPAGGVYSEGTEVNITATASAGYRFESWSGAVSGTNATTTVVMDANKSVTANFIENSGNDCDSPETITLPYEIDGPGEFCIQTSGTINYINSWNADEILINGVDITNNYTGTMPPRIDGMYKISYKATVGWAHLEIIGTGGTTTEVSLSMNTIGNGTVSPGNGTYTSGTNVNLTATPASGWQFSAWSGDASGTNANTSILMDSDKSVTATFTEIVNPVEYSLAVNTSGSGSVSLSPAGGVYTEGTEVILTATPASGNKFDGYSGDLVTSTATATIIMNSNKTVLASFSETSGECFPTEPMATALPSINKSYNYVHVMGAGPDLSHISNFAINWDLANNGLWQFSMNTTNNNPSWYVNLLSSVSHSFSSVQPSITIAGSNVTGLDGSYWAIIDGDNFVLVNKLGTFSLYFSNSASSPCLKSAPAISDASALSADVMVYPNPATDYITVTNLGSAKEIQILNTLGQVVYKKTAGISKEETISIQHLNTGSYILMIYNEKGIQQTQMFYKK